MNIAWKIAIRNLRRHWRQSIAALLSVTAGFITLVLFEGYIESARRFMFVEFRHHHMFGDVVVEKEGYWSVAGRSEPWKFRLNLEEQKFIADYLLKHQDQVQASVKSLRVVGLANNGSVSTIFWGIGYDLTGGAAVRGKDWYWGTLYGKPLEEYSHPGVLLGQTLGRIMGCNPTPKLPVITSMRGYEPVERQFYCEKKHIQFTSATPSGQISALDLPVHGLIDGGMKAVDSKFIYLPLEKAQSLANTQDISFYSILLKNTNESIQFADDFKKYSDEMGFNFYIKDWREHKTVGDLYRRSTGLLGMFRNFVIVIILAISTLSVLNTLIKIVKERTREVGTWRSLGFTNQKVLRVFMAESVVMSLVGNILGSIISVIASLAVNKMGLTYQAGLFVEPIPFEVAIVPVNYLIATCILTTVCILASWVATRSVLKKKIAENLVYA